MPGGRRSAIAALCALAVTAGGCGGGGPTDGERSADVLGTLLAAVQERDGAAVCAVLTPNAVRSVERLAEAQRPKAGCADLVRGQLAGFRPPADAELEVTANREVSDVRREL